MRTGRSTPEVLETSTRRRTRAENHAQLLASVGEHIVGPRLHRMIREAELYAVVGLKKTQVAAMIKRGEFPKPVKLSEGGRAKAWVEAEIIAWQLGRLAARDAA